MSIPPVPHCGIESPQFQSDEQGAVPTHDPFWQVSLSEQTLPQLPQLLGSLLVLVHTPSQFTPGPPQIMLQSTTALPPQTPAQSATAPPPQTPAQSTTALPPQTPAQSGNPSPCARCAGTDDGATLIF
jgi:hypothetical protein